MATALPARVAIRTGVTTVALAIPLDSLLLGDVTRAIPFTGACYRGFSLLQTCEALPVSGVFLRYAISEQGARIISP
jgi:hypothetical protein